MYILDTNYLIRAIVNDDIVMSTEAKFIFQKVADNKITVKINTAVFFEAQYVLTKLYKYSKVEVYENLIPFVEQKNIITEDRGILIDTLELFSNSNLDIVDCYLITQAKNQNLELLTFDKKCINKLKELLA